MKKKCLTVLLVATMAISMTACGKEEKKDEGKKTEISTEVAGTESTEEVDVDVTTVEDNEDISAEGPGRRWIMEQDLSIPTVASPTDALGGELIDNSDNTCLLSYPISLSDFEDYVYYRVDGNEYYTLEDALADEECLKMIDPGDDAAFIGFGITTEIGEHDHVPIMDWIGVKNPTDKPVSYKECIENKWFYMNDYFGDSFIGGYDKSAVVDLGDDGYNEDGEDLLAHYVKMFGAPTYFNCLITKDGQTHEERIDEFIEGYKTDNTLDLYYVGWEFDEYVLTAYVVDGYYGYWALKVEGSEYYSRELWDALKIHNGMDYFKSRVE